VADCTRAAEGLISDADLREEYEITDAEWKALTKNKILIRAIQAERARRVRSGLAAKEAAAKELATGPQVLGKLLHSDTIHPKHATDLHRELRATAHGGGDGERAADTEKFVITIIMGEQSEHFEKEIAPTKPLIPVIENKANDNDDE
jgi:hypothetical protein